MFSFNDTRLAKDNERISQTHRDLYCPRLLEKDCPAGMHKAEGEQLTDREECCETLAHKYCTLYKTQKGAAA